jgi:hypothetical protein
MNGGRSVSYHNNTELLILLVISLDTYCFGKGTQNTNSVEYFTTPMCNKGRLIYGEKSGENGS